MNLPVLLLCLVTMAVLLALLTAYICFRIVFYASRKGEDHEEISLPTGKAYVPYKEEIIHALALLRFSAASSSLSPCSSAPLPS